ncbi:AAA family ATPase, partial [Clostridium botulinum]
MKKSIKVGTSDFKKLIKCEHYFVDKSLLIKEFIENSADVILTPRPRRFGKTLNMSMLKYFFDIENKDENKDLFKGLEIGNEEEIMKMQGAYPVIFLTFKNEKHLSFENLQEGLIILFSDLYREYDYLLESNKILDIDKKEIERFIAKEVTPIECLNGLNNLMRLLNKHYDKKVIVLIDEYDVPIQESYLRGYYEEAIVLIRNILTAALKDNVYLEK